MNKQETLFQIYGRTRYEEPLRFVQELVVTGSVKDETLVAVGDEDWVELVAVPTAAFLHVIGKKEHD